VRTLQGIKKGIAVLDERRAELREAEAEADAAAAEAEADDGDEMADVEEDDAARSGHR
jgi:hypothetical protein